MSDLQVLKIADDSESPKTIKYVVGDIELERFRCFVLVRS